MVDTYLASNDFPGDGTTTLRTISFKGNRPDAGGGTVPYISVSDVKAVEITPATPTTPESEVPLTVTYVGPNQFNVTPATPVGKICRVYRATQDEYNLVDFQQLQAVSDSDLDLANRQLIFVMQEAHDTAVRAQVAAQDVTDLAFDAIEVANAANAAATQAAEDAAAAAEDAQNAADSAAATVDHSVRIPLTDAAIPALPTAAARADKLMSFDSFGNPSLTIPAFATAAALQLDLANSTDPLKGATMIGMDSITLREIIHHLYNDGVPDPSFGPALIKWFFNATGAEAMSQYAKNAEEISVAVFGVTGIGDDTAAMIEAINWANSQRITFNPTIGGGGGSAIVKAPVLTIPHNWTVSVQGNLPLPPILKAKGKATIASLDNTKDIFVGPDTYMVYMSDITFLHGRSQCIYQNANINSGMWLMERCTFEGSNSYAVQFLNTSGSYPVTSTQPILNECRFIRCKLGIKTQADHTFVCGGWMQPEGDFFDADTAFIYAGGMLSLNMVMTIPGGTFPAKSRWIDNWGAVRAFQTRFGGEGGGLPIVYQWAAPVRYTLGDAQNIECGISFLQCTLYGGNGARADASIIYLKGNLPNVVRITDCTGPITAAYIRNEPSDGGIPDIAVYIANLKTAWSGDYMYNELSYHFNGDKSKYNSSTIRWPAALNTYVYLNGDRYIPWRVKLQNTVAQTNLTSGGTVRITTPTVLSDEYGLAGLTSGDTVVKVPPFAKWATVHAYVELNSHTANNLLYLLRIYNNNTPVVDGTFRYAHSATGIPGIHSYAKFPVAPLADIDMRVNQSSGGTLTANVGVITVDFE